MEYTAYSYSNMAVDFMGCLVILALMVSFFINQEETSLRCRAFFLLLTSVFFCLASKFLSWAVLDLTDPFWWRIYAAANFLAFFTEGCMLACYILYSYLLVESKSRTAFRLVCLCLDAVSVYMLAILATPFNGMLYSIDPQTGYQRGAYYVLGPLCTFFIQVSAVSVIFMERRALGRKRAVILSGYMIFPAITVPVCLRSPDLPIGCAVLLLTMMMLHVDLLLQERSSHLLKREEENRAVMLSRLQPHFLFNSLTCISRLCAVDAPKASDALEHFSYFLRRNINFLSNKTLIPFEQEMVHVQDYLYLEKMRFGERLDIRIETEDKGFMIPPLTLLPIVENAVRYGILKKESGGTVTIRSERLPDIVVVTVTDDGVGLEPNHPGGDSRLHAGITNVKERLEIQCGGSLLMRCVKGAGTEVKLVLPQRRD